MSRCCGGGIPACEAMFGERVARHDLRRLRHKGPPWATKVLIDRLADAIDLAGLSVTDIGAGVGAVHLALLERGAARALDIDGSSAYLAAAHDEAVRRGLADRVEHRLGDVTSMVDEVPQAALVALDRVICCFPDLDRMLGTASLLATRRLGLVYPRDTWWARLGAALLNPVAFVRRQGFRLHIHRQSTVAARLRAAGFQPRSVDNGWVWRVETWERLAT